MPDTTEKISATPSVNDRQKRRRRQVLGIDDFTDADIAAIREQHRKAIDATQTEDKAKKSSNAERP